MAVLADVAIIVFLILGSTGVNVISDLEVKACDSSPCLNTGSCTNDQDPSGNFTGHYVCHCHNGFFGRNCETAPRTSVCDVYSCENGGSCSDDRTPDGTVLNSRTCHCFFGYTGDRCQSAPEQWQKPVTCDSEPCQNGALCVIIQPQGYLCDCPPGFAGQYCERIIEACASGPCWNYATCVDDVDDSGNRTGGFTCRCQDGYSGKYCEHGQMELQVPDPRPTQTVKPSADFYSKIPCNNHGVIQYNYDGYHFDGDSNCLCNPGYTGRSCEFELGTYLASSCCVSVTSYGLTGGCKVESPPSNSGDDPIYRNFPCHWYANLLSGSRQDLSNQMGSVTTEKSGVNVSICHFRILMGNVEDYYNGATFEMSASPFNLRVTNIPLSTSCSMDCGEDYFACDQVMCQEKFRLCNFHSDCEDGTDESFQTCRWWCVIDRRGNTCIILLATIPSVTLLLIGIQVLLCKFRPSKKRGKFLERRPRSDVATDKFDIVRLWFNSLLYYCACCCCRIFVPSRQRGQFLEEREIPNDPADDKFTAAGRFAKRNCLEMTGLWAKSLLYYCACCCCRIFVPSRQRGRVFEEREVPMDTKDKFEAAGRFAKKNCLEIVGLWLQSVVYYICCCCFWRGKEAAPQESPYSVLVPGDGGNPEKDKDPLIAPVSMDMARPIPATIPGGSELSVQLLQYVENV